MAACHGCKLPAYGRAEARQTLLLMTGLLLLLLHTLDVVTQHLPMALSTALSKTLATLQAGHAWLGLGTMHKDVLCCPA
jgi:hypothetical protein